MTLGAMHHSAANPFSRDALHLLDMSLSLAPMVSCVGLIDKACGSRPYCVIASRAPDGRCRAMFHQTPNIRIDTFLEA
jgi:hypothetical protein